MIRYDFHMHSSFSGDSDTPPEQQAEEAIRLGASGICFTDHMDYDYPMIKESGTDFLFDDAEYYARMCELRDAYTGRLEIMNSVTGIMSAESAANTRYVADQPIS